MHKIRLLFTIWGLFGVFTLLAQSPKEYSGKIIDGKTGELLVGVLIRSVHDTLNATLSDDDGQFSIRSQQAKFEFTYTGYQTSVFSLQSVFQTLKMMPDFGYLNQVVVSGNKSAKKLRELTVSLDIIQPKLIEKKNVIKVENVLQQVSSVHVTDKQVNIRNSSGWSYGVGSRVMILQDGMPMLSGDAAQPQWTFITTDNIQNIEVLKGASSLLYGSSALGGIVHIQTAMPTDSPLTRIQTYGGVYSKGKRSGLNWTGETLYQKGIRLLDSRKVGKWDLISNMQYISDDGYRMGDYEERFRIGINSRYHLNSRSYFGLNAQMMSNRSASFLLWTSYDSAYTALQNAFTENQGFRLMIDPKWVQAHTNGKQVLQGRYFRIKNNIDNGDTSVDQSNSSDLYYAEYQFHQRFPKSGIKTTGGLVFQKTIGQSPLFQGDHTSENQAAFIQLEKRLGALLINLGGRYERYKLDDRNEERPVFRTGLNYALGKATYLRSSFGQGYRFPSIAESFIQTKLGAVAIFPNEELESEFGNNLELAVKQGWKKGRAKGYIDLALFQMQFDNMMEFSFARWSEDLSIENGLGFGFRSINVGKTRIRGLELSTAGELPLAKGKLQFFGGYTYSLPMSLEPAKIVGVDQKGNELSYDSTSSDPSNQVLKYRYRHLARLDVQYNFKGWQLGVSTRYNGYMDNIDRAFIEFPINFSVLGVSESRKINPDGDLIFDFRMSYSFWKMEVGLNILNVFNREVVTRPGDLGPPRYSNISLRYDL